MLTQSLICVSPCRMSQTRGEFFEKRFKMLLILRFHVFHFSNLTD